MNISFGRHESEDVSLHFAAIGDPEKPLIMCLHGFPEYWAAWRDVMIELAEDFFLVAPDQRGFNLSSRPSGVEAYRTRHMVADLASLADRLSPGRPFVLAGHDWGASVAYAYAFRYPERLSHLVVVNGVHPACFQRAIIDDAGQRQASQYINRLRAPDADKRMAENDCARTLRMIEGFSQTGWMNKEKRRDYVEAWSRAGAMTGMLNWYRASPVIVPGPGEAAGDVPLLSTPPDSMRVTPPHLVVWGEADEALRPACLEGLDAYATELTIRKVAGAGHWILHEKPAQTARLMRDFIAGER